MGVNFIPPRSGRGRRYNCPICPPPSLTHLGTRRRACARFALFAALLVSIWTAARIHYVFGGNWTALFYNSTMFPVPPELEEGTYRFEAAGYDGQFYRFLAHDPFLLKGYARNAGLHRP